MSIFFIALGAFVREKNAKYLLAGYNTMSEAERKKVDIKGLIRFFRRFHFLFGVSFLMLGLIVINLFSETTTGVVLTLYPVLAYIYLAWKSMKYYKR